MRLLRKILLSVLVVLLVLVLLVSSIAYLFVRRSFPQTSGTLPIAGLQDRVEVYRDKWGVPHIYANNAHDLFFAQGYVHAQDRLWQMEFNRRIGAGRLSEVLGEATLKSDRFLRTIGLYRAAQADLQVLPPEVIAMLQAYADGVNAFISTHLDRLPLEFALLGFKPEPWTPTDTLAWGKVMCLDLGGNWESELLRAKLISALGEEKVRELVPPYPEEGPFVIPPEAKSYTYWDDELLDGYQQVKTLLGMQGTYLGSNNWVVDGTKTVTGRPMLANDPHLGIQMPSIWYEIHLVGDGLDVVGASFPGAPGVIIGHNRYIAWGVTNVGPDVQDLYVEKVNPDNPDQYEYMGAWEDMTVLEEEIKIKGRAEPEKLTVRLTRHGPIMTPVIPEAKDVLALRWTALEGGQLLRSVYLLDRARNWEEFREALRYWQAPSQNFVYADVEGNIGYQMPGDIPIRAKGRGLLPVPGWTGEYEWTGYIPFEELPFVFNPPTHYIVTANHKVVPDDYPYFISDEWAEPFRAQRIIALLQSKDKLTLDDFRDIQADTYSIPGTKLLPYVLQLGPQDWRQERAFKFLRAWDGRLESDSGSAGIMEVLLWRLLINTFGDELEEAGIKESDFIGFPSALLNLFPDVSNPWFDDVSTPEVETRDDILRRSLAETMDFWGRRFGDLIGNKENQWAWGKVHVALFEHPLGSVKPLHLLFNRGPVPARGSGETVDNAGYKRGDFTVRVVASYRQIIDVGEWRNSRSQHTTGQSGQPLHKHYGDMIASWQDVRHHPMLYEKEDIVMNAEGLLVMVPK
ncbi:MAG: penicillin acylase family protein [Anaerolineae bacterium]